MVNYIFDLLLFFSFLGCQTSFSCHLNKNASALACLHPIHICDGTTQCLNEEDEKVCDRQCVAGEYSCGNRCLPNSTWCDGLIHCLTGEDEAKCTEKTCSNGSKWCKSLKRCIPKDLVCNGRINCDDGSDEEDCDCKTCTGQGKRLCEKSKDIGFCILSHQVCDGTDDCPNGEDEDGCLGHIKFEPIANETITCKDGKKYSKAYACSDLIPTCAGVCKKSEAPSKFVCKDKKQSIPPSTRCDGRLDCDDGSDEEDCSPELCAIHPFVMYGCEGSNRCFRVGEVCNPFSRCPQATVRDTLYCAGHQTFLGHF